MAAPSTIWQRIRRWWKGGTSRPTRSWEAAKTTRLNETRWALADDNHINLHLTGKLKTLRTRATYEARNNPYIAAAVRSMRVGIVGAGGPRIQVMSTNRRFNEAAERVFAEWWRCPDINGQLSGVDLINQWVGYIPTCGEFFAQFVTDPSVPDGEIQTRILSIDPRRCEHPISGGYAHAQGDGKYTVLGVERTATGKPLRYSFRDGTDDIGYTYRHRWVDAEDVIHGYRVEEAGQVRGYPLVAECLDSIAELREFDEATLRAARHAAEHTAVLTTDHPDLDFEAVDDEIEIEPGMAATVPPGYKLGQMKAEHPNASYREFRHEQLRSVGMAFQQPLMSVLMDSSGHNYSSARFDGQTGARVDATWRRMIEQVAVERMFWRVIREAQLLGLVPAATPRAVRVVTHWEPRPHVDPKKEAEAAVARLAAGLTTHTRECALVGLDYEEDILDVQMREREARAKRGIPDPEVLAMPSPSAEEITDAAAQAQKEEAA